MPDKHLKPRKLKKKRKNLTESTKLPKQERKQAKIDEGEFSKHPLLKTDFQDVISKKRITLETVDMEVDSTSKNKPIERDEK